MKAINKKEFIRHLAITIFILSLCTLLSLVFVDINVRPENIIMIYLIGVLFIVIETKKIMWGISASIFSIINFNYFFTAPIYTLYINDPNYIITIVIFLIVSIITGVIMGKMQKHAEISKYNEQQTLALYEISKSYLNLSGIHAIILHNIKSLYDFQKIVCVVYYYDSEAKKLVRYEQKDLVKDYPCDDNLAQWCYTNTCDCGHGTSFYNNDDWLYCPLHHGNEVLGVYAILQNYEMGKENELFIHTMISQMVMAIEREQLYTIQEKNRIEIEKEKLRNNLLRSISHDLRTPLTSIVGSSSLILDNHDHLDQDTTLNLIKSIHNDSQWLTQLVENLLNMTRIQDGHLILTKEFEVVDDIIYESVQRCKSRTENHTITPHLPEDVQLVEMDGKLIIQVLVNFIDNAIKHTPEDSHIDIYFKKDSMFAYFEVVDDGNGIDPSIADTLFDSFVTTNYECADSKRGIGLGLSISKAIVEAHNGDIYAKNRTHHKGAVFGFRLPLKENKRRTSSNE